MNNFDDHDQFKFTFQEFVSELGRRILAAPFCMLASIKQPKPFYQWVWVLCWLLIFITLAAIIVAEIVSFDIASHWIRR